jgi:hypothetical protein
MHHHFAFSGAAGVVVAVSAANAMLVAPRARVEATNSAVNLRIIYFLTFSYSSALCRVDEINFTGFIVN